MIGAVAVVAVIAALVAQYVGRSLQAGDPAPRHPIYALPTAPGSYIGLYPSGVPSSYVGAAAFTEATGVSPNIITYYRGWLEPFRATSQIPSLRTARCRFVQIDPTGIDLHSDCCWEI